MASGQPTSAYLIDSIEHIPPVKLPPCALLDDRATLADLLAETVQSITDQEADRPHNERRRRR